MVQAQNAIPDLTASPAALAAAVTFLLAYFLVIAEEFTRLRKSKSVLAAAGVIWILVAVAWRAHGLVGAEELLRHNLLEYAELFLFLLAAMTYVNTLQEREVFSALRAWLIARRFTLRSVFWITGALAFTLSPILDNLTTALVMGTVVLAMGRDPRFVTPACINIVVAANAGGAFSPFGDITTLMVWQEGHVAFFGFLNLFLPSLVNWLVPAACMAVAVPSAVHAENAKEVRVKRGGGVVIALFACTIAGTVALHQLLHLPPFLGMTSGLGALMLYGYAIRRRELREWRAAYPDAEHPRAGRGGEPFDIFISIRRVEWDTLMFFYGVILCVGGLGAFGYLTVLSDASYASLGPSVTNILVGVMSAIVDNIPIMFAVLSIEPQMSHGQWLLVTLTAGVGGSLLSIGSAAGVALMGQARGLYTFFSHLKWVWAIALGYMASVWLHFLLNARLF